MAASECPFQFSVHYTDRFSFSHEVEYEFYSWYEIRPVEGPAISHLERR